MGCGGGRARKIGAAKREQRRRRPSTEDGGRRARTMAEVAEDRRRRTSTDGSRVAAPERGQRRRRRFLSAEDGVASVLPSPCATSRCPHLAPPWGKAARTLDTGEPCPVGGKGRGRVGLPPAGGLPNAIAPRPAFFYFYNSFNVFLQI